MEPASKAHTIVLAGGGTGGHVFPLIAVAEALSDRLPDARLVFVGTERGIETQVVPARGFDLRLVHIEPIRGRGFAGGLRGVSKAVSSVPEAVKLLRELEPKVVFSIGGYAAGSVSAAAKLLRIPLALMEPNAVVGLANRLIARFVDRAYTSYGEAEAHFSQAAVKRTGLAIRQGFEHQPYTYDHKTLRVLVLGGSQGAKTLNEAVPTALAACSGSLAVVHQSGKGQDQAVREAYRRLGVQFPVEVLPFINDMPAALGAADLVVGRSGAGALAELCAVGRPSVLIPYPFASGDHQYHNAQALVRGGAAVCVRNAEASAERLQHEVEALLRDPELLPKMAERALQFGKPDAAKQVAEDLLSLGGLTGGGNGRVPLTEDEPIGVVSREVH